MDDKLQVKVGVALDPASKQKVLSELKTLKPKNKIKVLVDADTKPASKKIQKLINKYAKKKLTLNVDAKIGGTNTSRSSAALNKVLVGQAQQTKKKLEKTFQGVKFNTSFTDIGAERKRLAQELQAAGKSAKVGAGYNVKRDTDGNITHFAFGIKNVGAEAESSQKSVAKLFYTLKEIDGQKMFVLDSSSLGSLPTFTKQIDNYEQKLKNLKALWGKGGTLSSTLSGELQQTAISELSKLESILQKVRGQAVVTGEDVARVGAAFTRFDKQPALWKKQLTPDSKSRMSLEQYNKQIDTLYNKMRRFQADNPKTQQMSGFSGLLQELGQLDRNKVDVNGLNDLKSRYEGLVTSAHEMGLAGQSAFSALIGKAKELGLYLSTSIMFTHVIDGFKMMVSNVVELDTALTELKKTTNGSQQDYANFIQGAANTAQAVGAKISDVVQSAAEWSRSGYGLQESGDLAKAANMYMNVSEYDNITDATQSMISSMKAYGYEASNVMTLLDKFNAVGNTTATSSSGLGDALLRSASALATAGNTIDQSLGLVVAANETVQNPEKVGNGLKTISLRIRNTKGELEELGEESDGAVESITKLQTQLLNQTHGKVNIFDSNGQFRSTYDILTDLSQAWGSLDSVEQANITTMLAGATQANTLTAIMQNMSVGAKAVETSLHSQGSAAEENARWMDSIQGRMQQLSASFQELSATAINTDFVKGFISGGQSIIEILNQIISTAGVLKPLLAGFGVGAFIKNFGWLIKHRVTLIPIS